MPEPPQGSPTGVPTEVAPKRASGGEVATQRGASRIVASKIVTLKKRAEFLATRRGARWATPCFVLEALRRPATPAAPQAKAAPRFGFTVSKKVGGAVERNRIKRRLRAAVAHVQAQHASADFDYVLIARTPALDADFSALTADLEIALKRVNTQKPGGQPRRPGPRAGKPK